MTDFLNLKTSQKQVVCPKHGTHNQFISIISSDIEGHEGHRCLLCWLESLGSPLPLVVEQLND